MPKEYVSSKYEKDIESTRVRVGWSKDADYVEIGTIALDGEVLEPGPEANGWFLQLDRAGINRLIKVLRTARDDAYGKDQ